MCICALCAAIAQRASHSRAGFVGSIHSLFDMFAAKKMGHCYTVSFLRFRSTVYHSMHTASRREPAGMSLTIAVKGDSSEFIDHASCLHAAETLKRLPIGPTLPYPFGTRESAEQAAHLFKAFIVMVGVAAPYCWKTQQTRAGFL